VSADLRVDWFPRIGEIFSVGGFYKDLTNPIEQVFLAAASSAYSFQNAKDARVLGLELEAEARMDRLSAALTNYTARVNYSLIDSNVNVRQGVSGFEPTNLTRPLEGQAAYVLNTGLSYAGDSGFEASLFLNRFGKRLTAAGGLGIPDIYERPRNALDVSMGFPLPRGASARIEATNLLDAPYRYEQTVNEVTLVQRRYTTGRSVSVGLSWEF